MGEIKVNELKAKIDINTKKVVLIRTIEEEYDAEEYLRMLSQVEMSIDATKQQIQKTTEDKMVMETIKEEVQKIRDKEIEQAKEERTKAMKKFEVKQG